MNNISIKLCDYDNKFIINNMYPLYLYDLGEIRNIYPNSYGVFEDDDSVKTLEEQIPMFDIWWKKKDILFPYLITVDGTPAGFALVATPTESNAKTIRFWRKTLSNYTKNQFTEEDKDIPEYEFGKVFKFSNKLLK